MTGSRGPGVVRRIAAILARLVYRDVEVAGHAAPSTGPLMVVANHFGGLADAVLLLYVSERFPRIVARDLIWRVPVAGWLMRRIGAIPVHRRVDSGGGPSSNDEMFGACYAALRDGGSVLIFPEGVTQDDPFIAPVKTGAARIALGATMAGAEGLVIQPVGIHYENKAAFRSRVLVVMGEPIDLGAEAADLDAGTEPLGADNRLAVRDLTDRISDHLRAAAPDYDSWDEARAMELGAEVVLRSVSRPADSVADAPLALTRELASRLAKRPDAARSEVEAAAGRYDAALRALRTSDYATATPRASGWGTAALGAALVLVLLPYALAGVALGLVPYLLTQATRLIPAAPAMRATIMPAVAFVVFLTEWVWLSVSAWSTWGRGTGALVALLAPAFVSATVVVAERVGVVWRVVRRWWFSVVRGSSARKARERRAELLAAVRAAL